MITIFSFTFGVRLQELDRGISSARTLDSFQGNEVSEKARTDDAYISACTHICSNDAFLESSQ